jgi:endonuclease/exonuclease/phosphatase (EEP) superfamily protein YafD
MAATRITVATANTHFGQMVNANDGFAPVAAADILLLQEVYSPKTTTLKTRLNQAGFTLVHYAPQFGLAIALRDASEVRFVPGSTKEHILAKMGRLEHGVIKKAVADAFESHQRGFISCDVTIGHTSLTLINVHPTTPVGIPLGARRKQIAALARLLIAHYAHRTIIVGGDMNHYQGPQTIDKILHSSTNLTPITIGKEPTWYALGSKQEPLLKVASFFTRRPLDRFNGQHDIILYSSHLLHEQMTAVVDISSDHRAVIATLSVQ